MNEDQLIDAAEREIDIYRAEIERITADRDEYRDNAVLHVRERDAARAVVAALREQLVKLIYDLEASSQQTSPSKKTDIERGVIRKLQAILFPEGK